MNNIEERARLYARDCAYQSSYDGYIKGCNDTIEKAIKWLDKNMHVMDFNNMIENFKKSMEE